MKPESEWPHVDIYVRQTLLWRASRWHCDCQCDASQWTVRLFVDAILVNELVVDNVRAMLSIAEHWRDGVEGDAAGPQLGQIVRLEGDRRQNPPERRAVPRGGRRATDPR